MLAMHVLSLFYLFLIFTKCQGTVCQSMDLRTHRSWILDYEEKTQHRIVAIRQHLCCIYSIYLITIQHFGRHSRGRPCLLYTACIRIYCCCIQFAKSSCRVSRFKTTFSVIYVKSITFTSYKITKNITLS